MGGTLRAYFKRILTELIQHNSNNLATDLGTRWAIEVSGELPRLPLSFALDAKQQRAAEEGMKSWGSLGITWHQEGVAYHVPGSPRYLMWKCDVEGCSIKPPHSTQI